MRSLILACALLGAPLTAAYAATRTTAVTGQTKRVKRPYEASVQRQLKQKLALYGKSRISIDWTSAKRGQGIDAPGKTFEFLTYTMKHHDTGAATNGQLRILLAADESSAVVNAVGLGVARGPKRPFNFIPNLEHLADPFRLLKPHQPD